MAAPALAQVRVQAQPDYPALYPSPSLTAVALVVGPVVVAGQQRPPCAVDHEAAQSLTAWVDQLVSWVLDAGQQLSPLLRWCRLCGVGRGGAFGVVLRVGLLGIVGTAVELGVELRGRGLGLGLVFGPGVLAGIECVVVVGGAVEEWREVVAAVAAAEVGDGRAR